MKPTPGRIVMYQPWSSPDDPKEAIPAIVTRVVGEEVYLHPFVPWVRGAGGLPEAYCMTQAEEHPIPHAPGDVPTAMHWHWPPKI